MSGGKIGGFIAVVTVLIVSLAFTLFGTGAATIASDLHVSIREWDVPTKGAHPHDPAVGKNGDLWFTEQMANKIGRFDPTSQNFKEYPLTGGNAGPHGLVSDNEGNIWFTANFGGYIGKLDPQTGHVTQYKMPVEKADDPHTAVFDNHGTLWFTVQGGNMVGRLDPKSGKIELKNVPTESALPYGIAINSKAFPSSANWALIKWPRSIRRQWPSPNLSSPKPLAHAGWRSRPMIRFISLTSKVATSGG